MKKLMIIAAITTFFLFGCKEDKPDPVEKKNYSNCKIMDLAATLPANDAGAGWDVSNGPDVYCKILVSGNEVLNNKALRKQDNSGTLVSWVFTNPLIISNLANDYNIGFWDYDDPDPDDYMGSVMFKASDYPAYPQYITLNSGNASVTLNVIWY